MRPREKGNLSGTGTLRRHTWHFAQPSSGSLKKKKKSRSNFIVCIKDLYLSELKQNIRLHIHKQNKAVYNSSPFISVAADVSSLTNEETMLWTIVRRDLGASGSALITFAFRSLPPGLSCKLGRMPAYLPPRIIVTGNLRLPVGCACGIDSKSLEFSSNRRREPFLGMAASPKFNNLIFTTA